MSWSESFDAVVDDHTKGLIIGSMPGKKSLHEVQYYAHPRNAFWPIMQGLFDIDIEESYSRRLELLNKEGIGLWDVYQSCYRPGSLDSAIDKDSASLNDFAGLLRHYPNIQWIFCNGKAAHDAFVRHVLPGLDNLALDLQVQLLTSTSPANARLSFEQKLDQWSIIKACHNRV